MAFRKRSAAVVAALLVGAVTISAPAATARTDASAWPCNSNKFCIYYGTNGTGAHYELEDGASDLSVLSGRLNDHVWSARNNTKDDWCLFRDAGYRNKILNILDGQSTNLPSPQRNEVSSVRRC
ncbi:peptidase inhibitor family I36 protein (plasmid) [Embleya sp. NBC_00888]|uniref:peptidase inhibitor family I36 protein n=1 Tax=Embleya sp. NBC_00888 TaxID=2975960 RepID=UPI002F90FF2B|nr:peptidase inhibitor family I36 protein [Embleya sp. NBC_00888]